MSSFQTILVPLDGSDTSEQAIPLALDLAKKYNARLTFFRILTLPPLTWNLQTVPNFDGLQSQMSDLCLDYLEELRKKHAQDGLEIDCQFSIGAAAEEILMFSEKLPHSMIVMATHGRDGLQRWMLGSVAERVARHSPSPVLLVRANIEEKKHEENTGS
jgi:nucleotide-binding universal stress UspA family protein